MYLHRALLPLCETLYILVCLLLGINIKLNYLGLNTHYNIEGL